MNISDKPILVTGATGYIGGRLVPALLEAGHRVRAAARSPAKLKGRRWSDHPHVTFATVDLFDGPSLASAMEGCRGAYYLVHSMNREVADFAEADRQAATLFRTAADDASLDQVVYLSGLGQESPTLSSHLRSRHEVGEILRGGKTSVTILQAAMIIGSGSASFEIMRYLVDRLPIMVTPRWVQTEVQPIAVRNVIEYLVAVFDNDACKGETFDIGGPGVITYRKLFDLYADVAHLRHRWVIPVPVLTPTLSSYWINMVTPVPASIARPLAKGLSNRVVTTEDRIRQVAPVPLLDYREALERAVARIGRGDVESSWRDAGRSPPPEEATPDDADYAGGTHFSDRRWIAVAGDREAIWARIQEIGGAKGWPYAGTLWKARGLIDRIFGGYGLARGRRSASSLRVGDALDMWRVSALDPGSRLHLHSEMFMPGEATLTLSIIDDPEGKPDHRIVTLHAWFAPRGLAGILYWYAVAPLHNLLFPGTLRSIAKEAGCRIVAEGKGMPHRAP